MAGGWNMVLGGEFSGFCGGVCVGGQLVGRCWSWWATDGQVLVSRYWNWWVTGGQVLRAGGQVLVGRYLSWWAGI